MCNTKQYSLLPCTEDDFTAISKRGYFCFSPYDTTEDDDPVSLDTFFCNVLSDGEKDHFFKTYKLVDERDTSDILALASISNSSMSFCSYESKPEELQDSGFNDVIPAVKLLAFGVRKDCQKKGLGTLTFNMLKEFIKDSSIAGVRILILQPLESAIPFYQSKGFQIFYTDEFETDIDFMYMDLWKEQDESTPKYPKEA